MYQIELAILFSAIPSLKKTSENSLQGSFRRVQRRFCPLSFDGTKTRQDKARQDNTNNTKQDKTTQSKTTQHNARQHNTKQDNAT